MSDSTNALQAIAQHLGRPIETGCKLIENILDLPTRKLGELIGDQVSYWQWSNRLSIAEKASKKLGDTTVRQLPLDFAVPFLRESGDAADPMLQEWWSQLLATAVSDEAYAHIAFVNTLHSMSPPDVKVLDALLNTQHLEKEDRCKVICAATALPHHQVHMSMYNLDRLGFFSPTGSRLTGFAFSFFRACSAKSELVKSLEEKQKGLPKKLVVD